MFIAVAAFALHNDTPIDIINKEWPKRIITLTAILRENQTVCRVINQVRRGATGKLLINKTIQIVITIYVSIKIQIRIILVTRRKHKHQTLLTANYGGKPHTRNANRRCCAHNTPVPTLIFAYKPLRTT